MTYEVMEIYEEPEKTKYLSTNRDLMESMYIAVSYLVNVMDQLGARGFF